MKMYLKKKSGFTLMEVVISIAIVSVISLGVYNAYLLLIKQTKAGQVRQTASLEGKKVIEGIKSTIENDTFKRDGSTISFGEMKFKDIGGIYTRYLDEQYNEIGKDLSKYTETIVIDKTKTDKDGYVVLDKDQFIEEITTSESVSYKFYIGKDGSDNTDYIKDDSDEKELISDSDKIILYAYFYENDNNEKSIVIKDFEGEILLPEVTSSGDNTFEKVNLFINFSEYKQTETSALRDVEINVYNQTTVVPDIYMEKDSIINAYINPCKGEINIYDNRIDEPEKAKIGTLYDIKVEIENNDGDIIFTGNSKQNIEEW